jgi:hypothetical protein
MITDHAGELQPRDSFNLNGATPEKMLGVDQLLICRSAGSERNERAEIAVNLNVSRDRMSNSLSVNL